MASNVLVEQAMADLVGDILAGTLSAAKVGLFMGPTEPGADLLLADLTATGVLPDYTGYAEQVATFAAATRSTDGSYVTRSKLLTFKPSGGTPNNVITGWYVTDGAGTPKLLMAGRFDSSIPIGSVDSAAVFVVEFSIGPGYPGGAVVIE